MCKPKIIFFGQLVPEKNSELDQRISQAGNNYQHKLIRILEPDYACSLLPIFLQKEIINEDNIIYINKKLRFKNFRLIRVLYDTFCALKLVFSFKTKNLLFYNIDKQNILTILISKFILKRKVLLIMADNPNYSLKSFYDKIIYFITKKIDGVLIFNSSLNLNDNQQQLHGLLEKKKIKINDKKLSKKVIFSGSLGKTTGFELALETFSKINKYDLLISGIPYGYSVSEFESIIDKYSKFKNIKYLGLLSKHNYDKVLNECDIALSLRNPNDLEHQHNFPSKILEYLSQSKIVISTLEYDGFENKFLYKTDFNSKSLIKVINNIYKLEEDKIFNYKRKVYNYLLNNFTKENLNEKLNTLIKK